MDFCPFHAKRTVVDFLFYNSPLEKNGLRQFNLPTGEDNGWPHAEHGLQAAEG